MRRLFSAVLGVFIVASCGAKAEATIIFVTSLGSFGSLPVYEDFEGVLPKDTALAAIVSNSILYEPKLPFGSVGNDNVWVSSPGYSNYGIAGLTTSSILTTNGNEWFFIKPGFTVRSLGFDTYTINDAGSPNSVPLAKNVLVTVVSTSESSSLSLTPPAGNFGFLGIFSTDPIVSVEWQADLGGVRNTGIDNIRLSAENVVPEPGTLGLLGLGLLTLGIGARFRR